MPSADAGSSTAAAHAAGSEPPESIAVIGAGRIGRALAHRAALAGFHVILEDLIPTSLEAARREIRQSLDEAVRAGLIEDSAAGQAYARIECATSIEDAVRQARIVMETGTEEIAGNIRMISELASNNTREAYHAVEIIGQMNSVIGDQLRTLDQFQIPHKALLVAKSDHMLWKKRLTEMLLGRTELRINEVTDHHNCRFGKWYYSEGMQMYGSLPAFRAIEEPHQRIHDTAKRVVELYHAGNKTEAEKLIDVLAEPTARVLEHLDTLHAAAVAAR